MRRLSSIVIGFVTVLCVVGCALAGGFADFRVLMSDVNPPIRMHELVAWSDHGLHLPADSWRRIDAWHEAYLREWLDARGAVNEAQRDLRQDSAESHFIGQLLSCVPDDRLPHVNAFLRWRDLERIDKHRNEAWLTDELARLALRSDQGPTFLAELASDWIALPGVVRSFDSGASRWWWLIRYITEYADRRRNSDEAEFARQLRTTALEQAMRSLVLPERQDGPATPPPLPLGADRFLALLIPKPGVIDVKAFKTAVKERDAAFTQIAEEGLPVLEKSKEEDLSALVSRLHELDEGFLKNWPQLRDGLVPLKSWRSFEDLLRSPRGATGDYLTALGVHAPPRREIHASDARVADGRELFQSLKSQDETRKAVEAKSLERAIRGSSLSKETRERLLEVHALDSAALRQVFHAYVERLKVDSLTGNPTIDAQRDETADSPSTMGKLFASLTSEEQHALCTAISLDRWRDEDLLGPHVELLRKLAKEAPLALRPIASKCATRIENLAMKLELDARDARAAPGSWRFDPEHIARYLECRERLVAIALRTLRDAGATVPVDLFTP